MSLVSKFSAFQIDLKLHVSKSDLEFCEQIDNDFKAFLAHEENVKQKLLKAEEVVSIDVDENKFSRFLFGFNNAIEDQQNEINSAREAFVQHIVEYFNTTYCLALEVMKAPATTDYTKIIHWVLKSTDGNLSASGERKLIEDFRNAVYYSDRWKVQGNKLVISHFYLKDRNRYQSTAVPGMDDKNPQILLKALSYWCDRKLTIIPSIGEAWPQSYEERSKVTSPGKIEFGLSEVQEIRFYLNDRLDIVFHSPEQAHAFAQLFELHTLEEKAKSNY